MTNGDVTARDVITDWSSEMANPVLPGHTIVILPPIVISNLLPCDLHFYFKVTVNGFT